MLALLALSFKVVQGLSWLALVVGMIVTMKTWWLAFLIRAVFRGKAAEKALNTSARAAGKKD